MLELSYTFIIKLYKANKSESDPTIPDAWLPDQDKLEEIED